MQGLSYRLGWTVYLNNPCSVACPGLIADVLETRIGDRQMCVPRVLTVALTAISAYKSTALASSEIRGTHKLLVLFPEVVDVALR